MATLNKYNQMYGLYADDAMLQGDGMLPPSTFDDEADIEHLDKVEKLEEMYDDYLDKKVEGMFEGEAVEDFDEYATEKIKAELEHETVNVYAEEGIFLPYAAATWWKFDEPKFDMLEKAGKNFENMKEDLNVASVLINRNKNRAFAARFEFPQYEREFKHKEAIFYGTAKPGKLPVGDVKNVLGWIDFVAGVPFGSVEKMGVIGEVFSKVTEEEAGKLYDIYKILRKKQDDMPEKKAPLSKIGVDGKKRAVAPVPNKFFSFEILANILFNKIWIEYDNTLAFTNGLEGYPKTEHDWWTRINLIEPKEDTEPEDDPETEGDPSGNKITPGEIIGTVIWTFPNLPWGWQETSPFVFSANRVETVYYTTAIVLEVIDDTTYLISYNGEEVEATSSDYAVYEVDDRVAILKGAEHSEDSMTWEDLTDYNTELWSIIPVIFYHKEEEDV